MSSHSGGMTRWTRVAAWCVAIASAAVATPLAAQTYTVARTSYHTLFADTAHADAHLCNYVAYRVTASVGVADLWATIGNFAGGRLSLAATEDGVTHLGAVPSGGYAMAYFYVCGDVVPNIGEIIGGQTHTLTLWDRDPTLPDAVAVDTTNWTLSYAHAHINAQANKIDAISVTPADPVLGGTFTVRVDGRTGTVGDDEHLVFTAAAHAGWPAAAFELDSVYIDLPDEGSDTHILVDELVHTGLAVNSANTPYFALYTFRVLGTTAAAVETSPYGFIDSGSNLKHTDVSHLVYPPIPPTSNPATLSKTADPTLIVQGTATDVTFAVRIANSDDGAIRLDELRDVLPAGFSFVSGSATYGGAPLANPLVYERDTMNPLPEQNLVWIGAFDVPALGSQTLVFRANVPASIAVGDYDNCATARIDGTQIDTTADTTDNAPACARVTVIGTAGPAGRIVVRKATVGGGGTFAFTASPAPLTNFSIDATAGSGAQVFDPVPNGTYTVTETVPAGWALTNIACTVTQAGSTATTFAFTGFAGGTAAFEPGDTAAEITLGVDAQVECTFTDTQLGSIQVAKTALPGTTGQSFAYAATGTGVPASFSLQPPATPSQGFANLGSGAYTITETVPAGWTLTDIACVIVTAGSNTSTFAFTGAAGGTNAFEPGDVTASITLGAGDDVGCTYTNAQNGSIAIVKQTVGGDGTFGFDTNGTPASAEVNVTTTGGTGNATAFASTQPGLYSITEIVPATWTLSAIACTSGGGSTFGYVGSAASGATQNAYDAGDVTATIDLAAGDAVTCTFTDDQQATVTVRKQVVPFISTSVVFDLFAAVNGGQAQLVANDVPHDGAGVINVPANATVVASETMGDGSAVAGFAASWTCTGTAGGTVSGAGDSSTSFVAPPGGDVVCTFTNATQLAMQSIPTLSQWSVMLLGALLLLIGMGALAQPRR